MIPSTQIKTAINSMYLPNTGTMHMYFEDETSARQESTRTGKPIFKSIHYGQVLWSIRID